MSKVKLHITLLFLTLFMLIKIVGFHSLAHSEEHYHEEDCEVCEYVITLNTISFLKNEPVFAEQVATHNFRKQLFYEYSYRFTQNQIKNSLFCRPPPTV